MVEAQNAPLIAQAEAQKAQAEIQASQAEAFAGAQTEAAKEQAKVAMEQVKQQAETERAQMQLQFDRWKAELEAATKIEVANIGAAVKVNDTATKAATAEIGEEVQNAGDPMAEVKKALTDLSTQMGDLQKKASAKRIKTPERGPDGRISRVIETLEE
jgi:hypothetical protein